MKKMIRIFSLALILILLIPSNLALASTDPDRISILDIRPRNDDPVPGDDSLYSGYVQFDKQYDPDVLKYTATVENEVKNVKVEVRTEGNVTVTGNNEYDLNVGENTIIVVATKPDGSSKTYTFVITRLVSDEDNTDLGYLSVFDGSNSYIDVFNSRITTYNVVVENEITEVDITGFAEVDTSTVKGEKYGYKLKTGNNKVELTVISKSGMKKVYVINIERKKSSDVSLAGITVNQEDISIDGKKNYTVKVLYDSSTVNITADTFDETTRVDGVGKHKIKVGTNNIKLTVIAQDGSKDVYKLKIIRAKPTTALRDLQVNEYTCGTAGKMLSVDVDYSTDNVEIIAIPVDKSAKVTGNGTFNLKVGKNKFYISVKAANGKTKRYPIIVNRSKYRDIIIRIEWD